MNFNSFTQHLQISNPAIEALNPQEGTYAGVAVSPLASLIARLWQTAVILGGILLLIYLVWGAVEWITSGGEAEKLKHARYKMTNATIGLFILVITFPLAMFLEWVFGFSLLNIAWPTPTT